MGRPAQGRIGAAGGRVILSPCLSRPSASGCAAGPRPQDRKSQDSPVLRAAGRVPEPAHGARRVFAGWPGRIKGLYGTGAKSARYHTWPFDRPFTTQLRNNARAGMQKRPRTRGSCTARSFGPLLSSDDHNSTSRNSWPSTRCSPISARHCRVAAVMWLACAQPNRDQEMSARWRHRRRARPPPASPLPTSASGCAASTANSDVCPSPRVGPVDSGPRRVPALASTVGSRQRAHNHVPPVW